MCFRLIDAKRAQHPVSLLCSVLGVSRAGYYAWTTRPVSARQRRDDELPALIRQIHDESEGSYGRPRMHAELRHRGVRVSRKRVARLMRRAGSRACSRAGAARPRSACPACGRRPISSGATSTRPRRTRFGRPT
jgi:putative transposase